MEKGRLTIKIKIAGKRGEPLAEETFTINVVETLAKLYRIVNATIIAFNSPPPLSSQNNGKRTVNNSSEKTDNNGYFKDFEKKNTILEETDLPGGGDVTETFIDTDSPTFVVEELTNNSTGIKENVTIKVDKFLHANCHSCGADLTLKKAKKQLRKDAKFCGVACKNNYHHK